MGAQPQHRPDQSGYDETKPTEVPCSAHDQPDPDAAGGQREQVASTQASTHKTPGTGEPGEGTPKPEDDEPLPPGEHKREPINDPDPADTKMYVQPPAR